MDDPSRSLSVRLLAMPKWDGQAAGMVVVDKAIPVERAAESFAMIAHDSPSFEASARLLIRTRMRVTLVATSRVSHLAWTGGPCAVPGADRPDRIYWGFGSLNEIGSVKLAAGQATGTEWG